MGGFNINTSAALNNYLCIQSLSRLTSQTHSNNVAIPANTSLLWEKIKTKLNLLRRSIPQASPVFCGCSEGLCICGWLLEPTSAERGERDCFTLVTREEKAPLRLLVQVLGAAPCKPPELAGSQLAPQALKLREGPRLAREQTSARGD